MITATTLYDCVSTTSAFGFDCIACVASAGSHSLEGIVNRFAGHMNRY